MSDRMSLDEARELVADWRFADAEQQRIARTIVAVGDTLDRLEEEVQQTSYRPRYDEGMTHVIRAIHEALGEQ